MDKSPLGKLSGELRNRIHRLFLVFDDPFFFDTNSATDFVSSGLRVRKALPLLRACKQIRQEASSIFFGENIFIFNGKLRESQHNQLEIMLLGNWLHQLGDSAQYIRHVVFPMKPWRAWYVGDDWKIDAIPARLKDLRTLFESTNATPRLMFDVSWSFTKAVGGFCDDGEAVIVVDFSDAATARKALREILDCDEAMSERTELKYRSWREDDEDMPWREDLEVSGGKVERLVKALELALGS